MNRGNFLCQLRMLALADELERQQHSTTTTTTFHPGNHRTTTSFYNEKRKRSMNPAISSYIITTIMPSIYHLEVGKEVMTRKCKKMQFTHCEQQLPTKPCSTTIPTLPISASYYDDLKHANINYIDYGHVGKKRNCDVVGGNNGGGCASSTSTAAWDFSDGENGGGRLVVDPRKRLGKGGLCWDAAFVLGEHVINQAE